METVTRFVLSRFYSLTSKKQIITMILVATGLIVSVIGTLLFLNQRLLAAGNFILMFGIGILLGLDTLMSFVGSSPVNGMLGFAFTIALCFILLGFVYLGIIIEIYVSYCITMDIMHESPSMRQFLSEIKTYSA